ncbi:uncharacterized protein LOC129540352 [Moschus berezovskii]|uniref:uncharacterized protein LOC129540352 n=1 Tax=Moschus berezovskii TaxID=68408 RepID=UPI00244539BE|nr:uncharacterized protein LOC129540352 [Moschus berezovskii]
MATVTLWRARCILAASLDNPHANSGKNKGKRGSRAPPGGAGGCGGGVPGAGAAGRRRETCGRAGLGAPSVYVRVRAPAARWNAGRAAPSSAGARAPARGLGQPGDEESGSGEARRDARTLTRTRRRGARPARRPRGGRARRRRRLGLRARRRPAPALQPPRGTARSSPPRATRRPAATFLEKDHTCAYSSLWRRDVGIEALSGGLCRRDDYACVSAPAQDSRSGEGDLLVLHLRESLQRESCSHPERMLLVDTVTDRLPWLSYHSADAVHSKGTVL